MRNLTDIHSEIENAVPDSKDHAHDQNMGIISVSVECKWSL
jgi:hypothetical protein